MGQVAQAAGVSKALLYRHFRSKEALLEAVLDGTLAAWERATGASRPPDGSVLEWLTTLQRNSAEFARQNPLMNALIKFDPRVVLNLSNSAAIRRCVTRCREALVVALRAGVDSGELRPDLDIEPMASLLLVYTELLMDQGWNEWFDASEPRA